MQNKRKHFKPPRMLWRLDGFHIHSDFLYTQNPIFVQAEVYYIPLYLAKVLTSKCRPEPVDPVRSSIGVIGLVIVEDKSSAK